MDDQPQVCGIYDGMHDNPSTATTDQLIYDLKAQVTLLTQQLAAATAAPTATQAGTGKNARTVSSQ